MTTQAQRKFEVKPLFAEPYFRMNIADAISPDQEEFIKNQAMITNQQNQISEELYLFDKPQLSSIKQAIQEALDTYAKEVMGISQNLEVTQSWSLINPPGVGMHGHTHSNSLISGSFYYTDMPDPPANMIFERFNHYRAIELLVDEGRNNIYNAPRNAVIPAKGDVILFSSGLQHYVEENRTAQNRYSIAFNTFVRGTIGSFRDVSQLRL